MVNKVELLRLERSGEGTFGVLRVDERVFCVTLEPPDRGNKVNVSCIPAGEYQCRRVDSPRFGRTFEVKGVPGRSHILLHSGNMVEDTSGCVLLGSRFGLLRGNRAVLESGRAFSGFMEKCSGVEVFPFVVENIA
ncbi:DUF5675 family protein [Pseudodesulfovibrio sp. zrk46]|uniref:DUF5675 family protein n=1 Tax=Pseudodesulfovibrio sp. zrk46 TaxID=2725288 RepID=UPI0014492F4D|nr:DUF5675 family protein [Pseudodesulfovibrio sp. zrk46]QJB56163.1 hypothetical protein HFN16_06935 [Pseudodesulfovibrio sp. zrk46]